MASGTGNGDLTPEFYLANNSYYQKRNNLDPERCKLNLERALKRKQRESQVVIACDHSPFKDRCQIRNIPYEELEDFHERYWECPGTVNKRVFVATYLTVEPTQDGKRDLNITSHCPRSDGSLDIICQKSFISVLGVSKHKVLAIGRAKLMNGEQLFRETRGGKRWKPNSSNGGATSSSITRPNKSNENSQNKSSSWVDNDSTFESNPSEQDGSGYFQPQGWRKPKHNESDDDDDDDDEDSDESEMKVLRPNIEIRENGDENDEDDNAIFEPQIQMTENNDDDEINDNDEQDDQSMDIFQPEVELTEECYNQNDNNNLNNTVNGSVYQKSQMTAGSFEESILSINPDEGLNTSSNYKFPNNQVDIIKKQNQPFEMVDINLNNNLSAGALGPIVANVSSQVTLQLRQPNTGFISKNSATSSTSYMGPENWKKTIERNIRRMQREKEVSINCNHNLTKFCKILRIPRNDLIRFHNSYWQCNGIVEERNFLARFLVVTPQNHRREMTITTRIPCKDGILYEVCQKSFLSVVGITKHKVQAAARAKLRGELNRRDGRGGSKPKLVPVQIDQGPKLQIAEVVGNYQPDNGAALKQNIRGEPTDVPIEIEDSDEDSPNDKNTINNNRTFDDSQTENDDDAGSQIMSAEDAFAQGKLGYNELRKDIENKRMIQVYQMRLAQMKRDLNYFKRRSRNLVLNRKSLFTELTQLKMENMRLKKKSNLKKNIQQNKNGENSNNSFNNCKNNDDTIKSENGEECTQNKELKIEGDHQIKTEPVHCDYLKKNLTESGNATSVNDLKGSENKLENDDLIKNINNISSSENVSKNSNQNSDSDQKIKIEQILNDVKIEQISSS